jgi:hypothetical protein
MNLKVRFKWSLLRSRLYAEHIHPRGFILPGLIFLFTLGTFWLIYEGFQYTNYWAHWDEAFGNAFRYCERNRMDQIVRQPANTWSNFGYMLTGLFAFSMGVQDWKRGGRRKSENFLVRHPEFSFLFGISCMYLFFGSFLYHASLTYTFQKMDITGLFSVIVAVLGFNLYKIFPYTRIRGKLRSNHVPVIIFTLLANYLIFTKLWTLNINIFFPSMIITVFITFALYIRIRKQHDYFINYMKASIIVLLLGSLVWILDRSHVLCAPDSVLQGHALWHLLTAGSIFLIYLYYRSVCIPFPDAVVFPKDQELLSTK